MQTRRLGMARTASCRNRISSGRADGSATPHLLPAVSGAPADLTRKAVSNADAVIAVAHPQYSRLAAQNDGYRADIRAACGLPRRLRHRIPIREHAR
jgi:hypothetical protein